MLESPSHHLVDRIAIDGDIAELWARGYAVNGVASLRAASDMWETWGTCQLGAWREPTGWRLNAFRYVSRFTRGDDDVRTHVAPQRWPPSLTRRSSVPRSPSP